MAGVRDGVVVAVHAGTRPNLPPSQPPSCATAWSRAMEAPTSALAPADSTQTHHDGGANREPSPDAADRLRESEFYKYYEPFKAAIANAGRSRVNGVVRSSDDRALTAFAQLGALRLGARRCAISFFDRGTQYVLAEATKTLSLHNDEPEDPKDALLWGVAEFPIGAGICQYTLRLPMEFVDRDDGHRAEVAVNCIPDMSLDPRFSDLPFVCGDEHTRFYAAVPIRSPHGVPLGSYCIMGDEPKAGLTPSEIAFLKDMATTVMVHLEMVRAREDIRRNALVIQGLGSFIEGESSIWEGRRAARELLRPDCPRQEWYEQQYAMHQVSAPPELGAIVNGNKDLSSALRQLQVGDPEPCPDDTSAKTESDSQPQSTPMISNEHGQPQGLDIRETFARAANIIRECMDVDGVVVYDATVSTFAGMVETDSDTDRSMSPDGTHRPPFATNGSSDSNVNGLHAQADEERPAKSCNILGFALPTLSALRKDKIPETLTHMTEKTLRRLTRRHPFGRAFSLDPSGTSPSRALDSNGKDRAGKEKRLRRSEIKAIRHIFPGVRSFMLVPFHHTNNNCNYAVGVVWSRDTQRIFSQEQALTYLAAFADSVMAEVARVEAKLAERTKSDFISSMSHELRSPLHGILGSVECLQETKDPTVKLEMLEVVETCGKTLLDTIDHLLDFAKINNFPEPANNTLRNSARTIRSFGRGANTHHGDTERTRRVLHKQPSHGLDSDIDIAMVTEEVIKTVQAGYAYNNAVTRGKQFVETSNLGALHKDVDVIIDIDRSPGTGWVYRTQAGAWRRIVMNLFGNALKYTDQGHIKISLRVVPDSTSDHGEVVFTIADTGCGISKEFQETRLFKPFAQENYLTPGTGLGLSIIKQIMKDMGGNITVRSEKGKGTVVEVKLVLARSHVSAADDDTGLAPVSHMEKSVPASDTIMAPGHPPVDTASVPEPLTTGNDSATSDRAAPEPTPLRTAAVLTTASSKNQPRRVLLVEDNEVNLRLLTMYMKKQGHYYETARDGLQALQAFQAATAQMGLSTADADSSCAVPSVIGDESAATPMTGFDFILMDISMPVMDGLESTRRIRAHERALTVSQSSKRPPYTPATIIALTGLASTQIRQEAYSSGVNYFMPKPVKLAELSNTMAAEVRG